MPSQHPDRVPRRPPGFLRPHTLLLAVYPVLFLYSRNTVELTPAVVVGPLLVVLAAAVALALLLGRWLRSPIRGGLLASLLLLLFFSYGHVYRWAGDGVWLRHRHLLPLWAVLGAAGVTWLVRTRQPLFHLDRTLTLAAAAATVAGAVSVAIGFQGGAPPPPAPPLEAPRAAAPGSVPARGLPDIYYIVLDAYAGDPNLREIYGFDNSDFYDRLARRGFFLAHRSRSNYSTTLTSTAATLNMDYLDRLTDLAGTDSERLDPYYALIHGNRVERLLRERGYRCVKINTPPEMFRRDFAHILLRTTVLSYWEDAEHYRRGTLAVFRRLFEFAPSGQPTFLYAHVVCPHAPYVFGPTGERVRILSEERLKLDDLTARKRAYLDQLRFVNARVDSLVDQILARSKRPPIIILQADHGPRNTGRVDRPAPLLLQERMGILNAYLLPDSGGAGLYESISPVNSFRLIFRNYFGLAYDLLPDRSYFSTPARPYQFIEVPETRQVPAVSGVPAAAGTPAAH